MIKDIRDHNKLDLENSTIKKIILGLLDKNPKNRMALSEISNIL